MQEAPPHKFGRYEVRAEIGSGAMGVVYRGYDPDIGRDVAIKTIKRSLDLPPAKRKEYLARFRQEARAAGPLSEHPNIVSVFDVGIEGDLPYIVMGFVEGHSLDRIRRRNRLTEDQLRRIVRDIGSALGHAHRKGVIHRDVKPANIMVTERGAVLTDFGIARLDGSELTRAGAFLGSPSYMSPEQVRGGALDGRSDLFSLAVVLYLLLTGEKPFPAPDTNGILYKIVNEEPRPPSELNPDFVRWDAFFARALAKEPDARFSDAGVFAEAFEAVLNGEPTVALTVASPAPTAPPPDAPPSGRAPVRPEPPANEASAPESMTPEPSVPAREREPMRWRYHEPEDRQNPLTDRSVFFGMDMKNQIPTRRSGSRTDTGRLERIIKSAGSRRPGTQADAGLPLPFWIGLIVVTLLLGVLVVVFWPDTPSTPDGNANPQQSSGKP